MLLLLENFRDTEGGAGAPPYCEPSSSPLSCRTALIPGALRGDFGNAGDLGLNRPPLSDLNDRCEVVEPSVIVRGWVEGRESTLCVRLGTIGEGASTLSFGSTGSGDAALGMSKYPCDFCCCSCGACSSLCGCSFASQNGVVVLWSMLGWLACPIIG